MDPAGYAAATSIASYIFGGIGYAFIIAMTATSFDRTAAAIGARGLAAAASRPAATTCCSSSWCRSGKRIPTCRSTRCS